MHMDNVEYVNGHSWIFQTLIFSDSVIQCFSDSDSQHFTKSLILDPGKIWLFLDFCKLDSATVSRLQFISFWGKGKEKKERKQRKERRKVGRRGGGKERRREERKNCSLFQDFSLLVLNSGYQWHGNLPLPHMPCASTPQYLYTYTPQYLLPSSPWLKSSLSLRNQFKHFTDYVPFLCRNSVAPHYHLYYVTESSLPWLIFLKSYSRLLIPHKEDYVTQLNWGKNRINPSIKGFGNIWRWFIQTLMRK